MFEKEAEEYTKRKYFQYGMSSKDYKQCFQHGAEFGYNKAKEWHYVKDKLPTHGNFVCNQDGYPCQYDVETRQWLDITGTQIKTTEWCELPYKESE